MFIFYLQISQLQSSSSHRLIEMSTGSISRVSLMIIRCFSLRPAWEVDSVSLISDSFLVTCTSRAGGHYQDYHDIQTLLSWGPSSILHLTSWTDFFLVTVILPPLSLQSSLLICQCHHNIKMSPVEWDHIGQSVLFWKYCSVPGSDGRRHWVATSPSVCLSHGVSTIVNCRPSHGC